MVKAKWQQPRQLTSITLADQMRHAGGACAYFADHAGSAGTGAETKSLQGDVGLSVAAHAPQAILEPYDSGWAKELCGAKHSSRPSRTMRRCPSRPAGVLDLQPFHTGVETLSSDALIVLRGSWVLGDAVMAGRY